MISAVAERRTEIAGLCRHFHVRRLEVFGSAARGTDFDPMRSDIDLLVTYLPGHAPDIAEYVDLRDALAELFGRPVDLVMANAVENPFVRAGIECPSPIEKSQFLPDRDVTRVRAMSGLRLSRAYMQADDPAPQVGHRVASPGAVIGVPACTARRS